MSHANPEPDRQSADEHFQAGNALMQAGRYAEAASCYERALKLEPRAARTHNNLAVACAEQGLLERALVHYGEALRVDPQFADAHYNCGNALRLLARYAEAVACYDRALELLPGWPAALLNRGLAYAAQGREALAEASYRGALAGRPSYPEAHNNLGLALQLQGDLQLAMLHFDRALELAPEFANAHSNRAQLRLLLGDLRRGWDEYEWRWRLPGVSLPAIDVPPWDGADLNGATVLLRAEQGFGDTMQFVRFAQPLQQAGGKVVIECQPALVTLLSRKRNVVAVVARGAPLPACDVSIPMASVPRALGLVDLASIPAQVPYLEADRDLIAQWRDRLGKHRGFRVGIAWRGSPGHPQDSHRSIPPQCFACLTDVPGVALVNLQVGAAPPRELPLIEPVPDHNSSLTFDDTAAIISNLDLTITCDTALAHLAGALAAPVWIALALVPDWRWLLERDESPWYPTARLFRQTRLDDWPEVFARIAGALTEHIRTQPHRE